MMAAKAKKPYKVPEPGDLSDTALFGAIRDAKRDLDEAVELLSHYRSEHMRKHKRWLAYSAEVDRRSRPVMTGGVDG